MSILRTYINGAFRDVCNADFRVRVGSFWKKVKPNDKVYTNGFWRDIVCSYAFKWIIDTDFSYCEKTKNIIDVGFSILNPFAPGQGVAIAPGFLAMMKKNSATGSYIFDLKFIYYDDLGVGPSVYIEEFDESGPSYNTFTYSPIGSISDPLLYPSETIHLYGLGAYGKALRGHIDVAGRIWIDAAQAQAITSWNPADPSYVMRLYNMDNAAEFGSINNNINTGYSINTKYKKVTDDIFEKPLDNLNQLTSVSGAAQDTKDILSTDANYKLLNVGKCPVDGSITYGNQVQSRIFTRQCQAGYTGSTVSYVVPANSYYASTVENANALAQINIDENGQVYANTFGSCSQIVFGNVAKQHTFVKECPSGYVGSGIVYQVERYKYTDATQILADQQALNDIDLNGQNFANANGTCTLVVTATYYLTLTNASGVVSGKLKDNAGNLVTLAADVNFNWALTTTPVGGGTAVNNSGTALLVSGTSSVNVFTADPSTQSVSGMVASSPTPNPSGTINIIAS